MSSFALRRARPDDLAAAAEVVVSQEVALAGHSTFSPGDLENEWRTLDLERNAWLAVDGDGRVVGYGTLHERGELWRTEAYVHGDAFGRGVGTLLATTLESEAAARGARRVQASAFSGDAAAHALLRRLGYREVREFRELRIELTEPPAPPRWPDGVTPGDFDPERDARAFHAAQTEAFADHWESHAWPFDDWREFHLGGERADPSLWVVARAGDEIAAGAINIGSLYGGGWVGVLFTRRPWRGRGVGAAVLADSFGRFWARGVRSVGLGVDAEGDTGAFQLYERAGMRTELAWTMFEKDVGGAGA